MSVSSRRRSACQRRGACSRLNTPTLPTLLYVASPREHQRFSHHRQHYPSDNGFSPIRGFINLAATSFSFFRVLFFARNLFWLVAALRFSAVFRHISLSAPYRDVVHMMSRHAAFAFHECRYTGRVPNGSAFAWPATYTI